MTIEQLRELTAIQAEDDALWSPAAYIETAYTQQALRLLTRAIEGDISFDDAAFAMQEMAP
jgi:hypothetical protein